jgi:hypothetical protein
MDSSRRQQAEGCGTNVRRQESGCNYRASSGSNQRTSVGIDGRKTSTLITVQFGEKNNGTLDEAPALRQDPFSS